MTGCTGVDPNHAVKKKKKREKKAGIREHFFFVGQELSGGRTVGVPCGCSSPAHNEKNSTATCERVRQQGGDKHIVLDLKKKKTAF